MIFQSTWSGPIPALFRVGLFWAGYLAVLLAASMTKGLVPQRWGQLVWAVASASVLLVLSWWMIGRERRSLADFGLRLQAGSGRRLLGGLALGAANYALIVCASFVVLGQIRFQPSAPPSLVAISLSVCSVLALATMEELGFRGYTLRALVSSIGAWPAQLIVAGAFGLVHLAYGWPWQTVLFGVLPSALLFGAAAMASRGLALPIGVHAGVNLARWAVGESETPGFGVWVLDGPQDGAFGSLAALIGLVVTLLTTCLLWLWCWRRSAQSSIAAAND